LVHGSIPMCSAGFGSSRGSAESQLLNLNLCSQARYLDRRISTRQERRATTNCSGLLFLMFLLDDTGALVVMMRFNSGGLESLCQ
jgi:hypothetical protein